MKADYSSLPLQMLDWYNAGVSVSELAMLTGLKEDAVVTRLCVASLSHAGRSMEPVSEDGAIGVQWRFVYWRA
jgi:hypothetical protein